MVIPSTTRLLSPTLQHQAFHFPAFVQYCRSIFRRGARCVCLSNPNAGSLKTFVPTHALGIHRYSPARSHSRRLSETREASSFPMDPNVLEDAGSMVRTMEQLRDSGHQVVIYVTGGAVQSLSLVFTQPGASKWILEASVPYSTKSLEDILSSRRSLENDMKRSASSVETALTMAEAAYDRAADLSSFGTPVVGVSATCALTTNRVRRGEDRAIVAIVDGCRKATFSLTFDKSVSRSRIEEDLIASRLVIEAMHHMMVADDGRSPQEHRSINDRHGGKTVTTTGSDATVFASGRDTVDDERDESCVIRLLRSSLGLAATDQLSFKTSASTVRTEKDAIQALLDGRLCSVECAGGTVMVDAHRSGRVYLPGSFNPLHEGHLDLLSIATRKTGMEGAFELSVMNADKGMLNVNEILSRVDQFTAGGVPIVLTRAALFTEKAHMFANSVFVVGYDTAVRLVNPKYYGGSPEGMQEAFRRLSRQGCRFLVAGRVEKESGRFFGLEDFRMPSEIREIERASGKVLFESIPSDEFRKDISSTELRSRGLGLST